MADDIRVSAMPFGDIYFAVIHRAGCPDEIVDGPDGKPIRCTAAAEAIRTARHAAGIIAEPGIDFGVEDWRQRRAADHAEEVRRVFGDAAPIRHGRREVVVVRKRRFG